MEPLATAIASLDDGAAQLTGVCAAARSRIEESQAGASGFLAAVEALSTRKDAAAGRLAAVEGFLEEHELSAEDNDRLASGLLEADGGRSFFGALRRLETVQARASALLAGPRHALGLELLDAAAAKQRAASELLFDWCVGRCREADAVIAAWDSAAMASLVEDANERVLGGAAGGGPASSSSSSSSRGGAAAFDQDERASRGGGGQPPAARILVFGLRYLRQHSPAYFRSCQNAAIPALRASFGRRFQAALTGVAGGGVGPHDRGGYAASAGASGAASTATSASGDVRPIEMHAHDPPRYVGDMLAWVHLALAEQREALLGLFGAPEGAPQGSGSGSESGVGSGSASVAGGGSGGAKGAELGGGSASAPQPTAGPAAPVGTAAAVGGAEAADELTSPLPVAAMLAAVSEGIASPLVSRVHRSAQSQAGGPVPLFRILDVLCFYGETLLGTALLPPEAPLLRGLLQSQDGCAGMFAAALDATAASISAAPAGFPADLGTSSLVASTSLLLQEALKAFQGALSPTTAGVAAAAAGSGGVAASSAGSGAAGSGGGVGVVLDALIPPLIAACRTSAEGLRVSDTAVYMINNLGALQAVLLQFAEAGAGSAGRPGHGRGSSHTATAGADGGTAGASAGWAQRLAAEVGVWEEDLVSSAANDLLASSGMLPLLNALRAHREAGGQQPQQLSAARGLSAPEVAAALQSFDALILSADTGALFSRVASPATRARLRRSIMSVLAAGYARVHGEVAKPESGYDARALLRRTPEQVEALLDLRT
jgi:hypothetical protein